MDTPADLELLLPLVERLGGRDWQDVGQAFQTLVAAGAMGREAVKQGLTHSRPRVRVACADFYDHLGRDEDVPVLCGLLDDPVPSVRRQAVHSLACQRCKPAPLQTDLTKVLIGLALHDPTPRVRREAVYGLCVRPSDPRVIAALEQILTTDANAKVVREARNALERLSPACRQAAIEAARARQAQKASDERKMTKTPRTILVVDVEATCWESQPPPGEQAEIIEIGWALLDVPTGFIERAGTVLVQPQRSRVSDFCTRLTTLTQEQVSEGLPFAEACRHLEETLGSKAATWASYGEYDRKKFRQQSETSGVPYPFGETHLNVKTLFALIHGLPREVGMVAALKLLGLDLVGTHHRGGDDARNIATILASLISPPDEVL